MYIIELKWRLSMNVVIVNGSPRAKGNSDILCDELMRGATESGNNVEKISLREKKLIHARHVMHVLKVENVYKKTIWKMYLKKYIKLMF